MYIKENISEFLYNRQYFLFFSSVRIATIPALGTIIESISSREVRIGFVKSFKNNIYVQCDKKYLL